MELPATVKLVAVSKFHPFDAIEEAYEAGQRIFAESRPQELLAKVKRLEEIRAERGEPDYMSDVQWHFIGHLQTNKLKMVLPYVSLVQSVDSVRLLDAINAWGAANGKVIDVLLEPHVAAEETKQGFAAEEIFEILSDAERYGNVRFRGIMGMATFTDDESVIRSDFAALRSIFDDAVSRFPGLADSFDQFTTLYIANNQIIYRTWTIISPRNIASRTYCCAYCLGIFALLEFFFPTTHSFCC